jgi:acetylornithine deacetylase/succinyl-diaminopimelate desuccinylase-like protein
VAEFLCKLPELKMIEQAGVGISTVVPTLYATDQISPNVIPGEVKLTLDWRNVPVESPEAIVDKIQGLLDSLPGDNHANVRISTTQLKTYTGIKEDFPAVFPSFLLAENDPFVQAAHATLVDVLGRDDGIDIWRFATDGGHLMNAGIPTIGFGPGDETLAHTNQERISLAQMEEAVVAYTALILALAEAVR